MLKGRLTNGHEDIHQLVGLFCQRRQRASTMMSMPNSPIVHGGCSGYTCSPPCCLVQILEQLAGQTQLTVCTCTSTEHRQGERDRGTEEFGGVEMHNRILDKYVCELKKNRYLQVEYAIGPSSTPIIVAVAVVIR
jgi:hypothetical protein